MALKSKKRGAEQCLKTYASPFSYRAGNTVLHRLPPLIKFALLFLISVSFFVFQYAPSLAARAVFYLVCAILILLGAAIVRLPFYSLIKGSKGLLLMCAIALAARCFDFFPFSFSIEGLIAGLFFCALMLLSFALCALFFACTTMRCLKKRLPARIGTAISLVMSFIPRFFAVWDDLVRAYKARGGKTNIRLFRLLLPAAAVRLMESAANTADALKARGME